MTKGKGERCVLYVSSCAMMLWCGGRGSAFYVVLSSLSRYRDTHKQAQLRYISETNNPARTKKTYPNNERSKSFRAAYLSNKGKETCAFLSRAHATRSCVGFEKKTTSSLFSELQREHAATKLLCCLHGRRFGGANASSEPVRCGPPQSWLLAPRQVVKSVKSPSP
jgi:hypothetical protein